MQPDEQIRMHLNPSDKMMMNRSSHLDPPPSPSPLSSFKDKFEFPVSQGLWTAFSFPTPPTSPVECCSNCQEVTREMRWHAASGPWGETREISEDELDVDDLPLEFARELCGMRAKSPAILNDIMWSGDRVRRPDSTTDFENRFSLSSTPTCFEQPISHTFVEPEELFSFSLLSHCHDPADDMLAERLENDGVAFDIPIQENPSDTGIPLAKCVNRSPCNLTLNCEKLVEIGGFLNLRLSVISLACEILCLLCFGLLVSYPNYWSSATKFYVDYAFKLAW